MQLILSAAKLNLWLKNLDLVFQDWCFSGRQEKLVLDLNSLKAPAFILRHLMLLSPCFICTYRRNVLTRISVPLNNVSKQKNLNCIFVQLCLTRNNTFYRGLPAKLVLRWNVIPNSGYMPFAASTDEVQFEFPKQYTAIPAQARPSHYRSL